MVEHDSTVNGEVRATAIETVASKDLAFGDVLRLWYEAADYERHAFSGVDDEHVLVRYGKVLEAIGGRIAPETVRAESESELDELLKQLHQVLDSSKSVTSKANRVVDISRRVAAIQMATIGSRVRAACGALNLDESHTELVMSAWQTRSQEGGHPGSSAVGSADLSRVRDAAAILVPAFVKWRIARSGST